MPTTIEELIQISSILKNNPAETAEELKENGFLTKMFKLLLQNENDVDTSNPELTLSAALAEREFQDLLATISNYEGLFTKLDRGFVGKIIQLAEGKKHSNTSTIVSNNQMIIDYSDPQDAQNALFTLMKGAIRTRLKDAIGNNDFDLTASFNDQNEIVIKIKSEKNNSSDLANRLNRDFSDLINCYNYDGEIQIPLKNAQTLLLDKLPPTKYITTQQYQRQLNKDNPEYQKELEEIAKRNREAEAEMGFPGQGFLGGCKAFGWFATGLVTHISRAGLKYSGSIIASSGKLLQRVSDKNNSFANDDLKKVWLYNLVERSQSVLFGYTGVNWLVRNSFQLLGKSLELIGNGLDRVGESQYLNTPNPVRKWIDWAIDKPTSQIRDFADNRLLHSNNFVYDENANWQSNEWLGLGTDTTANEISIVYGNNYKNVPDENSFFIKRVRNLVNETGPLNYAEAIARLNELHQKIKPNSTSINANTDSEKRDKILDDIISHYRKDNNIITNIDEFNKKDNELLAQQTAYKNLMSCKEIVFHPLNGKNWIITAKAESADAKYPGWKVVEICSWQNDEFTTKKAFQNINGCLCDNIPSGLCSDVAEEGKISLLNQTVLKPIDHNKNVKSGVSKSGVSIGEFQNLLKNNHDKTKGDIEKANRTKKEITVAIEKKDNIETYKVDQYYFQIIDNKDLKFFKIDGDKVEEVIYDANKIDLKLLETINKLLKNEIEHEPADICSQWSNWWQGKDTYIKRVDNHEFECIPKYCSNLKTGEEVGSHQEAGQQQIMV